MTLKHYTEYRRQRRRNLRRAFLFYCGGLIGLTVVASVALAAWGLADPAVHAELLEIRARMGGE